MPPLLRQGTEAGSLEFTATLFDLIRRGYYTAKPVTTEQDDVGRPAARSRSPTSSSRRATRAIDLEPWEQPGRARSSTASLDGGAERLSKIRDRIEDDRDRRTQALQERSRSTSRRAIKARRWYADGGCRSSLGIAIVGFAVVGAILFLVGIDGWRAVAPRWTRHRPRRARRLRDRQRGASRSSRSARRSSGARRTKDGELEAQRWDAFRRYLTDFPRLEDAPPATLELWERYLVYGIAFGIAERVLQGAQLHMPEELHDASTIYWISPTATSARRPDARSGSRDLARASAALAPRLGGSGGGFSAAAVAEAAVAAAAAWLARRRPRARRHAWSPVSGRP